MIPLTLIRHGATAWNEAGLIQGRADPPLSERGRAAVLRWRIPEDWHAARWYASPLHRARESAALLSETPLIIDPRLIEMDWGAFEGSRLADLRAEAPAAMAANEAKGLDFRPPDGESPREVCARLGSFLRALAADATPVVAVTHKGVIRAALALAIGWDMRAKPPVRVARDAALRLVCRAGGRLQLANPPLQRLCA